MKNAFIEIPSFRLFHSQKSYDHLKNKVFEFLEIVII